MQKIKVFQCVDIYLNDDAKFQAKIGDKLVVKRSVSEIEKAIMNIVVNHTARCGKPSRRGTCQLKLRGGICPVHDHLDAVRAHLSAIGKRGGQTRATQFTSESQSHARSHVKRASLQKSGRAGYLATGAKKGWQRANQFAITWRREHRSEPERWCEQVLTDAGYTAFGTEYQIENDPRTLDFAFVADRVCIEVNGHQDQPAFGETEARAAKHNAKVAWLEALGWRVLVVHPNGDRKAERERILDSLSIFSLMPTGKNTDDVIELIRDTLEAEGVTPTPRLRTR